MPSLYGGCSRASAGMIGCRPRTGASTAPPAQCRAGRSGRGVRSHAIGLMMNSRLIRTSRLGAGWCPGTDLNLVALSTREW